MIKSVHTINTIPDFNVLSGKARACGGGIHNSPTLTAGIAAGTSNGLKFVIRNPNPGFTAKGTVTILPLNPSSRIAFGIQTSEKPRATSLLKSSK